MHAHGTEGQRMNKAAKSREKSRYGNLSLKKQLLIQEIQKPLHKEL